MTTHQHPPGRTSLPLRLALCAALLLGVNAAPAAVRTAKKPMVNDYHGVKVMEDYQWLEKAGDPAVREWSAAQNQQARAVLDKSPVRPWVADRLRRLLNEPRSEERRVGKECA